jgi:hypothetical protein
VWIVDCNALAQEFGVNAIRSFSTESANCGHSCLKKLASGMTGLKAQQTLLVVATAMKNSTKQALEVR